VSPLREAKIGVTEVRIDQLRSTAASFAGAALVLEIERRDGGSCEESEQISENI
jgi:hypothetical protein